MALGLLSYMETWEGEEFLTHRELVPLMQYQNSIFDLMPC